MLWLKGGGANMNNISQVIGQNIRAYRTSIKMTQAEFAKRLGVTGASVSAYENGTRQPSFEVLVKIANVLGVSTDYLLGRTATAARTIDVSGLTDEQLRMVKQMILLCNDRNKMLSLIQKSGDPATRHGLTKSE